MLSQGFSSRGFLKPGSKDSSKGPWVMYACDLYILVISISLVNVSQKYIYCSGCLKFSLNKGQKKEGGG